MGKIMGVVSLLKELAEFIWLKKIWWLLPLVIIFLLFGILLFMTEGSAIAPFIYTLF